MVLLELLVEGRGLWDGAGGIGRAEGCGRRKMLYTLLAFQGIPRRWTRMTKKPQITFNFRVTLNS